MTRPTLLLGTVAAIACVSAAAPLEARAPPAGLCPTASPQGIVRTVSLPGKPRFLLLREQTLWVAIAAPVTAGRGWLARVDADTGRVERLFCLPNSPYRIAYGFGSLWLTGEARSAARRYSGAVLRLDPRTGRILRVIHGPIFFGAAIATTPDGVWVGGGDIYPKGRPDQAGVRFVFRIDPSRNAVIRRLRLRPTTVIDLLSEGRSLWATGWGAVVRLSPSGRVLFAQRFYGSGWSLARSPGSVWVAQRFSGTRDPRTQRPVRKLLQVTTRPQRLTVTDLASPPGLLSAAGGAVWLTGPGGPFESPPRSTRRGWSRSASRPTQTRSRPSRAAPGARSGSSTSWSRSAGDRPDGPLTLRPWAASLRPVSRTQIFIWCVVLIVVEINHLKWIWWTYWECGKCRRKHKDCGCSSKWIMLL